jgi:hypothetical protein
VPELVKQISLHSLLLQGDTERRGRVVNTPASYSQGHGFIFRSGDRLS